MAALPSVSTVAVITLALASSALAAPRTLTLRGAERAIDRAFHAELAGDFEGAHAALIALMEAAERPEEAAPRARLEDWLKGLELRKAAFARHGRAVRAYAEAFDTLRPFGLERADLLWAQAQRDVAALSGIVARDFVVDLRTEELKGAGSKALIEARLADSLTRRGIRLGGDPATPARFEARISVDASEAVEVTGGARVTAEASLILRAAGGDPRKLEAQREESRVGPASPGPGPADRQVVGAVAKRRSEVRRDEAAARAAAVRRVLDDTARALVFRLRAEALRQAGGAEAG